RRWWWPLGRARRLAALGADDYGGAARGRTRRGADRHHPRGAVASVRRPDGRAAGRIAALYARIRPAPRAWADRGSSRDALVERAPGIVRAGTGQRLGRAD